MATNHKNDSEPIEFREGAIIGMARDSINNITFVRDEGSTAKALTTEDIRQRFDSMTSATAVKTKNVVFGKPVPLPSAALKGSSMKSPGEKSKDLNKQIQSQAPVAPEILKAFTSHGHLDAVHAMLARGAITEEEHALGVRAILYNEEPGWTSLEAQYGKIKPELLREVLNDRAAKNALVERAENADDDTQLKARASALLVERLRSEYLGAVAPAPAAAPAKEPEVTLSTEEKRQSAMLRIDEGTLLKNKVKHLGAMALADAATAAETPELTKVERAMAVRLGVNVDQLIINKAKRLQKKGA